MSFVFLIHSEDNWRSKYFRLVWRGLEFFQPPHGATRVRVSFFLLWLHGRKGFWPVNCLAPQFGWELIILICNFNFRRQKSATTLATEQLHIILHVNLKTRLVQRGCWHIVTFYRVQFFWAIRTKNIGWVPLIWSGSGSVIRDHLDHGRSNETMNPCPEWIHR